MGRLEIRVCEARNIADTQKVGVPDPYVKVKMGDNKKTQIKYKTRVIENSLNPVWNELVKFQVADEDSTQILFEVWNDNILVDDLLGSYHLSLNGLHRGVVKDMWVILTGAKVTSTELHLRVLAVDFGASPGPNDQIVHSIEDDNYVAPAHQTYRSTRRNSASSQDDINNNNKHNNNLYYNTASSANTNKYNMNSNIHTPVTTSYSYPTQIPSPQFVQPVIYPLQPVPYSYSVPPPQQQQQTPQLSSVLQNSSYLPPPLPQTTSYAYQPQPMYAPPPQQPPIPYSNVGLNNYNVVGSSYNTIQYARGVPPPMEEHVEELKERK